MFIWKDVEPAVITLLKDEVPENSERRRRYDPDDLIAWWNNAQSHLATQRPVRKHRQYKDQGLELPLPEDFYRPRGVFAANYGPLPRMNIEDQFFNPGEIGYMVYEGHLIIANLAVAQFLLVYDGYYPRIRSEDSRVFVPEWAIEACSVYVALQAATREAIAEARYRKFATKQDAGTPQQLSVIPVLKWLEERFYRIVSMHSDDDQGTP
jgi:hypothetical protein